MGEYTDEGAKADTEIAALNDKVVVTSAALATAQAAVAGLTSQVGTLSQSNAVLNSQVLSLTGQLATLNTTLTKARADLAKALADLAAALAGHKLPLGTSAGGNTVANTVETLGLFPTAKVLRIYSPGLPTTIAGNPQFADAVARMKLVGGEVMYSFKQKPGDAAWTAILADWVAAGLTIRWTFKHEPDNPAKAEDPVLYKSDFTHLITVANPLTVGSKVSEQSILMAYVLDPTAPHGDPESWYVPAARVLGFDCYVLAAIPRVIAYAKSKGKPYTIPEFGGGGPSANPPGDDAAVVFLDSALAAWAANPPLSAAWFAALGTGASTYLRDTPKLAAHITTLA